jgi:hypothetical protein
MQLKRKWNDWMWEECYPSSQSLKINKMFNLLMINIELIIKEILIFFSVF